MLITYCIGACFSGLNETVRDLPKKFPYLGQVVISIKRRKPKSAESRTEGDLELVEKLMSWTGIDEIRATRIIGEMDCLKCKARLDPIVVVRVGMHDPDAKTFLVGYRCTGCAEGWFYDVKASAWMRVRETHIRYVDEHEPKMAGRFAWKGLHTFSRRERRKLLQRYNKQNRKQL